MELTGPEIVQETMEKIKLIQERLKIEQDRQKSYADSKRREIEFQEGDKVFLKVSPMKGSYDLEREGNLIPGILGRSRLSKRLDQLPIVWH